MFCVTLILANTQHYMHHYNTQPNNGYFPSETGKSLIKQAQHYNTQHSQQSLINHQSTLKLTLIGYHCRSHLTVTFVGSGLFWSMLFCYLFDIQVSGTAK